MIAEHSDIARIDPTKKDSDVFLSVQALRGISGLSVLIGHLALRELQDWPRHFSLLFPGQFCMSGGVEIFFVISGFIIASSTVSKFGRADFVAEFAKKRFYRIFPLYWILSAVIIGVHLFVGERDWRSWLACLFFVPGYSAFLNPVSWSLVQEVIFYTFFGLFAFLPVRFLPILLSVWATGIAAKWFAPAAVLPDWLYSDAIFHPYNFAFLFGVAAALATKVRVFILPATCASIGLLMMAFGSVMSFLGLIPPLPAQPECLLFLEFPAALLLYGAVGLEYSGRLKVPNWLVFAGDASYSIYLVHYMVIMAVKPLYANFVNAPVVIMNLWSFLVGAIALAASLMVYRWIEKPLLRICFSTMAASGKHAPKAVPAAKPLRVHTTSIN